MTYKTLEKLHKDTKILSESKSWYIIAIHTVNTKQIAWTTNSKDMSKNRTINVKDQSRNSKKIKKHKNN